MEMLADLAARWAPLVRVFPDGPPGDPAVWLSGSDLIEYDDKAVETTKSDASDFANWPARARNQVVRPYNEESASAAGFALVPRERYPKLLVDMPRPGYTDGRFPPHNNIVSSPCFYEVDRRLTEIRLTFWFFFPTSTTPANKFLQMLPALLDARRKGRVRDSGDAMRPSAAQCQMMRTHADFGTRQVHPMWPHSPPFCYVCDKVVTRIEQ